MRLSALEFEPGSAFNYSNNNVSLRQFIVERITATTFNRFVVERMFRPCGMTSSTLNPSADAPKIAKSFNNFSRQDRRTCPSLAGGRGETCLGFELSVSLPTCCGRGC